MNNKQNSILTIRRFAVENLTENCVTDNRSPRFSFALESGLENVTLQKAVISLNGWKVVTTEQAAIPYKGTPLAPFTRYVAELTCTDNYGETALVPSSNSLINSHLYV